MGFHITRLWGYLTGLIVIGIIIYLILLYVTAQSLAAKVTGIESVGFDPLSNSVKTCFTVQVNNTGPLDVTIEKIYYKIYVDNKYLGEGVKKNIIIGKGSSNIKLCLTAESKAIADSLAEIIVHGGKVNVTVEGYVEIPIKSFGVIKLWTVQLPFKKTVEVNIYTSKIKWGG